MMRDLVDRGGAWEKAYGVERDGAVLVRPDGSLSEIDRYDPPDSSGLTHTDIGI